MITKTQKTISSSIGCNSVALHSGLDVKIKFLPAPEDTGIIFKRTDIKDGKNIIKAKFDSVTATNLGTVIANEHNISVSTIEHIMAAIWASEIDNLIIEINNKEAPIMDGSSSPFMFLFQCAGIENSKTEKKYLKITQPLSYQDQDKFVKVLPCDTFILNLSIDFNNKHIEHNNLFFNNSIHSFKDDISKARTFCFKHEIEHMHKIGLAQGGSLDNAIVIDENGIVNSEGLRYKDEFVKHKALDFIGDIFLSGYYILGEFTAHKTGHSINNKFLHHLFDKKNCWQLI